MTKQKNFDILKIVLELIIILIDIIKAWVAGIFISLAALIYMIISPFGLGFKIVGALLFGCGLLSICEESLNLVTGKFGMLYTGSWNLR